MRISSKPLGWPLAVALAGAALAATPAAAPAQSAARNAPVMQVATGRGQLVTLSKPMSDLFVADSNIADVQVRSPTQLYVYGKKPGETTVSATTKGGQVVYAATVRVGNNYDSLGQMMALAMPNADIQTHTMNGVVLLTGTVANPDDSAEAERLVQAFVGEGTKVVSRLRSATPLQVNLQVRFAEVNRNYLKTVGVNLASFDGTGGFKFGVGQGRGAFGQYVPGGGLFAGGSGTPLPDPVTGQPVNTGVTTGTGVTTLGLAGRLLGLDLLSTIDLGETNGQVTTLANPNLTALSGETGTFLAGGEIPIPIAQAFGTISVEYKQYGVSLAYTPTVLSDGRISLRVRPEVSQLDYTNAVQLNGTRVPGLTTRRAETTVELGSGQSFMIGGLLQNTHSNTVNKAPFLGDLPILGALFRSNGFQRNETELVIVITPYLVKPMNANDIALPTDGYRAPTDAQRILLGTLADGKSGERAPAPMMANGAAAVPSIGASAPVAPAPVQAPTKKGRTSARTAPKPGFSF